MEEFKEKQKRQRIIIVEKYIYAEYKWKIDKIFTNVAKCYALHFKAFFWDHETLKSFHYQSFIKAVRNNEGIFEYQDFYGDRVRFRYTIHQLE